MNNVIETQQLTRQFGKCEAVHDLNLNVPAGSTYAFLGRNGAGKTTTIKMLAGLLRPTKGGSSLLGQCSRNLRAQDWQQIGYVSENQRLYEWLTGDELLAFAARLYPAWDRPFADLLVEKMDLPMKRKISRYSRGEKVKMSLLLSLGYRPRLLILDEPFTGLDPLVKEEFFASILEITAQNEWSMFFSTQDIDEVEKLADHVGIIEEGRLQVSERIEDLQARFRLVEIHGGTPQPPAANAICIQQEGGRLRFVQTAFSADTEASLRREFAQSHIEFSPMSLKEIFVSLAKSYQKGKRGA